MPGSIISGVTMVARCLSAVMVVTISAPRTASATLLQTMISRPWPCRLCCSLAVACSSTSYTRNVRMPTPSRKARAWNSDCAPLPISAITRLFLRASARAATTDMAAVRIAVGSVNSASRRGAPVATSARTPNAITVETPRCVFLGWPLTYLKAYELSSETGISSITPSCE